MKSLAFISYKKILFPCKVKKILPPKFCHICSLPPSPHILHIFHQWSDFRQKLRPCWSYSIQWTQPKVNCVDAVWVRRRVHRLCVCSYNCPICLFPRPILVSPLLAKFFLTDNPYGHNSLLVHICNLVPFHSNNTTKYLRVVSLLYFIHKSAHI